MSDETSDESNVEGKEDNSNIPKPEEDNKVDVQPEETSDVDRVKKEREALKAENDAFEAEQLRAEKLRAERVRGGRSEAGQRHLTPEQEIEEKAKKEAEDIVNAFQ